MNKSGAIAGILVGAIVVLVGPLFSSLGGWFDVYAMVPAFTLSCIAILVVSLATEAPSKEIEFEFQRYKETL